MHKKKASKILPVMAATLFVAVGCSSLAGNSQTSVIDNNTAHNNTPAPVETVEAEPTTTKTASAASYAKVSGSEAREYIGKQPVVLSFHADWCATCNKLKADIESNLSSFPEGAKFLELNFDDESELKKEFGVLTQSTLVILDENGEEVQKLAAPSTREITAAIEKSL